MTYKHTIYVSPKLYFLKLGINGLGATEVRLVPFKLKLEYLFCTSLTKNDPKAGKISQ